MTTYARLIRAGDEWKGKVVTGVRRYTDSGRRASDRVVFTFDDGSQEETWSESRLFIRRPREFA